MSTLPADAMGPYATPDNTPTEASGVAPAPPTEASGVAPAPRPPRAVNNPRIPRPSETSMLTPQADGSYS
jgi:hypothetical protein